MKEKVYRFARRILAGGIAVLLSASLCEAAPLFAQQQERTAQSAPTSETSQQNPQSTPGASPDQAQNRGASPSLEERPQASAPGTQQNNDTRPVGTAAAPVTKPTGVAGSRPAGAAIAPGKQRRVRKILVRVGIIVGAGVAVGAVAGLSRGSSSRP